MKKYVCSLLAFILTMSLILTACGQSENISAPESETKAPAATVVKEDAPPEAVETAADAPKETEENDEEEMMAEIEFYTFCFVAPNDVQHVEDAINEITEREINTHVHMTVLDIGSYIQQIGVMMAGGERIDLMLSGFATASYSSMMAQHQLMDISEYLEAYGQDIMDTAGYLMAACTYNDGIYAVPTYRDLAGSMGIVMRKDIIEELGLMDKAEAMDSVDEYIEILEAIKNSGKYEGMHLLQIGNGAGLMTDGTNLYDTFENADVYGHLGDTLGIIHVDSNGKVSLLQETDSYKATAAKLREMNDKGLLYFDISAETVQTEPNIAAGVLFSAMSHGELPKGVGDAEFNERCGHEMLRYEVKPTEISTETVTKFCFEVPITAEEPAAAVKFLNLCYTSVELNNLLAWGCEGVDYEVVDGVAHYIKGNEHPSFHMFDYSVPNGFLVTQWEEPNPDYPQIRKDHMNSAPVSKYLGFTVDLSEISTEIAAVSNVKNEYELQIQSGQASEEILQEYIDKLYAAGAGKIVEVYQTQLDEWLAGK